MRYLKPLAPYTEEKTGNTSFKSFTHESFNIEDLKESFKPSNIFVITFIPFLVTVFRSQLSKESSITLCLIPTPANQRCILSIGECSFIIAHYSPPRWRRYVFNRTSLWRCRRIKTPGIARRYKGKWRYARPRSFTMASNI